jgi:hypothetical protein
VSRLFTKNGVAIAPVYNKYEVLGITKNFDKFEIALTLRYIEPYTMPIDETYNVLVDESGNFATDESGNTNIIRG